jgi:hypothetical protein
VVNQVAFVVESLYISRAVDDATLKAYLKFEISIFVGGSFKNSFCLLLMFSKLLFISMFHVVDYVLFFHDCWGWLYLPFSSCIYRETTTIIFSINVLLIVE